MPVDVETLTYLTKGLDIALMPGSESKIPGGTAVLSLVGPNEVFVEGSRQLAQGSFASDVERLALTEQVLVAALETGRDADAKALLSQLKRRFPDTPTPSASSSAAVPAPSSAAKTVVLGSLRVARLEGMVLEAEAKFDEALAIYNAALDQDETYAPIIKRKVALLMEQGKTNDAITALVHYLDHFSSDLEAWTTLSNLYLDNLMFQQAAFCLEECLVLSTHNYLFSTRYAELMMTMNKPRLALKYFCLAVEVTESVGGALRSWYGARSASKALIDEYESVTGGATAASGKPGGKKGALVSQHAAEADGDASIDDWKELHRVAGERIEAIYAEKGKSFPHTKTVVKEWLKTN
ncbi:hypothetical protein BC830DRAFT_1108073 [Chytriomyces sp. MP71]|nr:hypothetical protein BC830DRAFT_1108073 [Chytriomyces sp. MP71]